MLIVGTMISVGFSMGAAKIDALGPSAKNSSQPEESPLLLDRLQGDQLNPPLVGDDLDLLTWADAEGPADP
jgi:hypothetical protein